MTFCKESVVIGDREISIETGKLAKQSAGSVIVRSGDTMVLVTANAASEAREGMNFLPLTCEYQEKFYAAGRIPGSFFRREGRPSEAEVLVCRLMDRPVRPLFPDSWRVETQVISTVLSFDGVNATDMLAITGASAALHVSDINWAGPIAGVRVGMVDGKFVAFPTAEQRLESDLDLIIAASRDAIVMVEGGMVELSESQVIDALMFGHESAQPLIELQEKIRAAVGKEKRPFEEAKADEALVAEVKGLAEGKVATAMAIRGKHERYAALDAISAEIKDKLCAEGAPYEERAGEVSEAYSAVKKAFARRQTIQTKTRIDGRQTDEIRDISCEVGVLPAAHGSALFTRGETQGLVTATLGTKYDEKRLDTLAGEVKRTFYLHYNFPPFSTGEVKRVGSTSRREIGHGFLAQRSVERIMPDHASFPYTTRVVSEILESNGSSSMASVCGASLALMDAGVPVSDAVAGIAMGLMKEGDDYVILSDILGDEDHLGDMDFKVTGTSKGICALQMDIKLSGLTRDILEQALEQARAGRVHILGKMAEALKTPREELSPIAPRIHTLQVKPDKIRDIIGPGGKTIRGIIEQTGAKIDVEDDGTVLIATNSGKSLQQAMDFIKGLTTEPEVGACYQGIVKRVVDFGAFVEFMPGLDGLVHISELAEERTRQVTDIVDEGDELVVKVINIDRDGKIRLSRKQAIDIPSDEVLQFIS